VFINNGKNLERFPRRVVGIELEINSLHTSPGTCALVVWGVVGTFLAWFHDHPEAFFDP
jgi:hypothetical protein